MLSVKRRSAPLTLSRNLNQQLFRASRPAVAWPTATDGIGIRSIGRSAYARHAPNMQLAGIREKLKRLAVNWPVAMLAFGAFLTLVWIGALIWIAFYLFVMSSQS